MNKYNIGDLVAYNYNNKAISGKIYRIVVGLIKTYSKKKRGSISDICPTSPICYYITGSIGTIQEAEVLGLLNPKD